MPTTGVDEAGGDDVDSYGRELEREVLRHGGLCGRESRDQRESRRGAAAAGAAHEEQGSSRANPARCVPSDLQRQQEMGLDIAARLLEVELRQPRVVRAGAR